MESVLFKGIPDKQIEKLYEAGHLCRMKRGQVIIRKGETAADFFIVVTGRAVVVDDLEGKKTTLATLDAGACFGEMAVFSHVRRSATVLCAEPGQLLAINEERLIKLAEQDLYPQFMENIIRILADRLRHVNAAYMEAKYGTATPAAARPQAEPGPLDLQT